MHSSQNCPAFFLAKFVNDPLFWITGVFALIASIYAITERDNIVGDCARAIRARVGNPMIHCEGMPQTLRPTTSRTCAAEIIKGKLPILISKVNCMTCLTAHVLADILRRSTEVIETPLPNLFAPIRIIALGKTLLFPLPFEIPSTPFSRGLTTPRPRFGRISSICSSVLFWFLGAAFPCLIRVTILATSPQRGITATLLNKEILSDLLSPLKQGSF